MMYTLYIEHVTHNHYTVLYTFSTSSAPMTDYLLSIWLTCRRHAMMRPATAHGNRITPRHPSHPISLQPRAEFQIGEIECHLPDAQPQCFTACLGNHQLIQHQLALKLVIPPFDPHPDALI